MKNEKGKFKFHTQNTDTSYRTSKNNRTTVSVVVLRYIEIMKLGRIISLSFIVALQLNSALGFGIVTVNTALGNSVRVLPPLRLPHSSYKKCEYRSSLRKNPSSLSATDGDVGHNSEKGSGKESFLQVLNAAFLVAGTTIGGGFLALPSVVAPTGFYPSVAALCGVWGFFLSQSFVLVECISRARFDSEDDSPRGVAGAAKSVFGLKGEIATGILLVVLIQATLVAQISRAGMLFSNYRMGCIASAFSIAALVFGPRSGIYFASKANAVLTLLFILSAFSVFGCGFGIADFSRLGMSSNWSALGGALPSLLQLLVYGEIVPTVCQLLKYNTKRIQMAITIGSFLTLCLQIGWSGLGLGLFSGLGVSLELVSSGSAVDVLLATASPVRLPLFSLAVTAILTTILGSYLALLSTVTDFVNEKKSDEEETGTESQSKLQEGRGNNSLLSRIKVASIISVPASLIACSSPSIFLRAIDFAGSYPVLMLWGVAPPVIALIQRSRDGKGKSKFKRSAGSSAWLAILASLSFGMVGFSAVEDIASFVSRFKGLL